MFNHCGRWEHTVASRRGCAGGGESALNGSDVADRQFAVVFFKIQNFLYTKTIVAELRCKTATFA